MIPAELIPSWNSLNESQKGAIIAQSKFYKLETPYQINNFWKTRGLAPVQATSYEALNESQNSNNPVNTGVSNSYMQNIAAELEKRFKK